jgi:DNA-binding transcriptional regulator YiaG
MSECTDAIRNPFKEVRQALELSQEQMALNLGCSESMVWRYEGSGKIPQATAVHERLMKLARQVGIEIEA